MQRAPLGTVRLRHHRRHRKSGFARQGFQTGASQPGRAHEDDAKRRHYSGRPNNLHGWTAPSLRMFSRATNGGAHPRAGRLAAMV